MKTVYLAFGIGLVFLTTSLFLGWIGAGMTLQRNQQIFCDLDPGSCPTYDHPNVPVRTISFI